MFLILILFLFLFVFLFFLLYIKVMRSLYESARSCLSWTSLRILVLLWAIIYCKNILYSNKYYTFQVCMCVTLVIQHAKRMRRVTCGMSGCITFFHIISWTARFSEKEIAEREMCIFIFDTKFVSFLISRSTQRDTIINVCKYSCKMPVIFVIF